MYLRCIREDDLYRGLEKIKKIAEKYGIEIEETLRDYCKPTDFRKKAFSEDLLQALVKQERAF